MPMDGFMLSYVIRELNDELVGGRVDRISQPEKDELLLSIRNRGKNSVLLISASANAARMHLTREKKVSPLEPPMFCMLMRKHLLGGRVLGFEQDGGDRVARIRFEVLDEMGDYVARKLVCEFMGRHSNVMLLRHDGVIVDSVSRISEDISSVRSVLPGLPYQQPPAQGKLDPLTMTPGELAARLGTAGDVSKALQAAVSGLSPQTAREMALRAAGDTDARLEGKDVFALSEALCGLLGPNRPACRPVLVTDENGQAVDVTPFPYLSRAALTNRRMDNVSGAQEAYFGARDHADRIHQKSSAIYHLLKNNIDRCEKKLGLQMQSLQEGERMEEFRVKGELLSASLYAVNKGQAKVELANYYDPEQKPLSIDLDVRLTPAQNAQRYFKLYQKARSAKRLAGEQVKKTQEELLYLQGQMENLGKCTEEAELYEIREELERLGYIKANKAARKGVKNLPPSKPLKMQASDGTVILIGKNNLQNDKLTFDAMPDEVWLHAKDIPGSHVIIVGENPSEKTIEEAAGLAAYYSKGRTGSRVAVDYTLRRYVKKPSGAKPGFVIYTHQRTLYVQPRETV
ncbi:MAG: NFACT family protein [Clostridia bacterium]|nr:NFACT family protein [Clostridia bacterium]